MRIDELCDEYELFYHHEFINLPKFSEEKRSELNKDSHTYFIKNDFTIYQEKSLPFEKITKSDLINNHGTFVRILYHLPLQRVDEFIEFHYDKYNGDKKKFVDFVYGNFIDSKLVQNGKELPPPSQKVRLLQWCDSKYSELNPQKIKSVQVNNKQFINQERIEQLRNIASDKFDFQKLIRLLEELNVNYSLNNFLSVSMLCRAVIDHVPPIFGVKTFNEVENNYGTKSFKKNMTHLNISMRSIADNYLHTPIRPKESIPNENQIDFSREFDLLLSEIVRLT